MGKIDQAVMYSHIPLQPVSHDIWDQKYRLRDADSNPVDADLDATYARTARALAQSEKSRYRSKFEKQFLEAMYMGATPAGRIMSNAGAIDHKSAVSLINCTVSDTIPDSMDGILSKVKEAGMTLKAGCGIGYEFSTIRPNGAYVAGAGASTSGPLSFMDIYDKTCFTVSSAGGRRGAQMATFDVSHPDVKAFIQAKREKGRFRQFNMSLLITDEFVEAVKAGRDWQPMWNGEPFGPAYPAQELWDLIMDSNYNFAEPGFLLIDHINRMNNLWFCELLRATNPCGEQPLPPYGACLLGSLNLTKFVVNAFTKNAYFDFDKFHRIVRIFTRMLDNVVEQNGLPLPQQQAEIIRKRRHGMGFLGIGSAFSMLGMIYGSDESIELTEKISRMLAFAGFEEGAALAKEKGEAPVLQEKFHRDQFEDNLKYNSNFNKAPKRKSGLYTGRELFLKSHYFDAWHEFAEGIEILNLMEKYGSRFSHHSSIAPTGTISFALGNNCSSGIEPTFEHHAVRNVIRPGRNAKEAVEVCSHEFLLYRELIDSQVKPEVIEMNETQQAFVAAGGDIMELCKELHVLPPQFSTTSNLTPKQHIDIQAAAQKWIDSSISKTTNVPTDISKEDFKGIYLYAYEKGLKGCTTFRYNPDNFQGVIVRKEDLEGTMYRFEMEDGSMLEVSGDTMIEYKGQTQTAANLYDAISEGYFGKL